jgi:hypothetical protein
MSSIQSIASGITVEESKKTVATLDRVGACISFACALHCILLPFVITALPLIGLGIVASSQFEVAIIGLSITLATASFCWGSRIHGKRRTLLFLLAALLLFFVGHDLDGSMHWIVMSLGGVSLAAGHLINRRLCRSCEQCHDH